MEWEEEEEEEEEVEEGWNGGAGQGMVLLWAELLPFSDIFSSR